MAKSLNDEIVEILEKMKLHITKYWCSKGDFYVIDCDRYTELTRDEYEKLQEKFKKGE